MQPGANLSQVARRYRMAARVLFRWKQELTSLAAASAFVTVRITAHILVAGSFHDAKPAPTKVAGLGK